MALRGWKIAIDEKILETKFSTLLMILIGHIVKRSFGTDGGIR